ncbi:Cullin repeat-like-containing domain protein [Mycena capillaripes]|nr:Cullin repeat-like-containing domain protein [Mycena capillaripes]
MTTTAKPNLNKPIADVWKTTLEPGITQILRGSEPLTFEASAAIYSAVYDCCTRTNPPTLDHCRELYSCVPAFYAEYTAHIIAAPPEDDASLLEYYDTQWDRFSRGAEVVDRLFTYLNIHFVVPQRNAENKNVETVLNVALTNWRTKVLEPLAPRLESALGSVSQLDMIRTLFEKENLTKADFKNMHVRVE